MSIASLFTRTLSMMFRNAALWVVVAGVLVIETLFGRLAGQLNVFTLALSGLVYLAGMAIVIGAVVQIFNEMAEGRNPSIVDGFKAGGRTAIPLVLVQLIWQVPLRLAALITTGEPLAVVGAVGAPEALSGSTAIDLVSSCSLTQAILVLVSLCAGAIAIGTDRVVVLEGVPVLAALARGWNLLREQFPGYLKIGVVLGLVMLALGLLAALPNTLTVGAAAFGGSVSEAEIFQIGASPFLWAVVSIFNVAFATLVLILLTGVWTLAFRGWQGKDNTAPA